MVKNGYLVISLDFELLWGVFDKVDFSDKKDYFNNTRKVIPRILDLFKKYDIHCTWATVGMLFNEDWEEWQKNIPAILPEYNNQKLSAYKYGSKISTAKTEQMVFAKDIIALINSTKNQEMATHTYSHYYCLEDGQNIESFKADLEKSILLAKNKFGIEIKSLVFPRNQFNREYLKVCRELGIETIRTNPIDWYWKNTLSTSILVKIARSGDAYLPFGRKTYGLKEMKVNDNELLEQKASRLLRPVEGNKLLRNLKLRRVEKEMTDAARHKKVYHLWWHPHNFGSHPEESLRDLEKILKIFKQCQQKYGYQSANMQEMNKLIQEA